MKTKQVEVKGSKFQVGKFDPFTGVWLLNSLLSASATMKRPDVGDGKQLDMSTLSDEERQDYANGTVRLIWTLAGTEMDEKKYRRILSETLSVCTYDQDGKQVPVMMQDGRAACDSLRELDVMNGLITEALIFNLSSFFLGDASSQLKQSA